MSGEDLSDKQWAELLSKVDQLVEAVNSLQRDLKDWKQEMSEEFDELTGMLVEHFQQVIDRHLLNKPVEGYYDGQTIDSPSSGEETEGEEEADKQSDKSSKDDSNSPSDPSVRTKESKGLSEGLTDEFVAEVSEEGDKQSEKSSKDDNNSPSDQSMPIEESKDMSEGLIGELEAEVD